MSLRSISGFYLIKENKRHPLRNISEVVRRNSIKSIRNTIQNISLIIYILLILLLYFLQFHIFEFFTIILGQLSNLRFELKILLGSIRRNSSQIVVPNIGFPLSCKNTYHELIVWSKAMPSHILSEIKFFIKLSINNAPN